MKPLLLFAIKALWFPVGAAFIVTSPMVVRADPSSLNAGTSSLAQYAPDAAKLFGNMITPASIMGGAVVPIGFAAGLAFMGPDTESKFAKILRRVFPFVCVAAFTSQLLAVMWASVAVNQLTENKPAMAASVWHLLQRDYALQWAAVNSHFAVGLLMFMWIVATKAFFIGGQGPVGVSAFTLALSAMTMGMSVVNRGIAAGGGHKSLRFGGSIVGLLQTYVKLFLKRSFTSVSPLEWVSIVLFTTATANMIRSMMAKDLSG